MNTGQMPSVTTNKNVNGENKKEILVNAGEMMTQSSSRGRGPYMDLEPGQVNPVSPSNKDTYQ